MGIHSSATQRNARTRRALLRQSTALAAAAALPACGGVTGDTPVESRSQAPAKLRITSWLGQPPSLEVYEKHLFQAFREQSPQTTFELETQPSAAVYTTKIQAHAAGGDLPDVLEVSYKWFPDAVKLGWIENLDAVVERDRINPADYDKAVMGMGRWPYEKGPIYSWWTMMSAGTFFFNKSLFDR